MRRYGLAGWAVVLYILGFSSLHAQTTPASPDADLQTIAFEQRPGAQLPLNVALQDERHAPVTLAHLLNGPPLVLTLGYFNCPNLCSVTRDDLFHALQQSGLVAGTDYTLIALSIDPAERQGDSAAQTKSSALSRFSVKGDSAAWHFVTAEAATIRTLTDTVGFHYRFDPQLQQFQHPAGAVILTSRAKVAAYLLGVGYRPEALRAAVIIAAGNQMAPPAPAIRLLCYHFDPATGRYTLSVLKLMRSAALLTVLVMALWLGWQHIRTARSSPRPARPG